MTLRKEVLVSTIEIHRKIFSNFLFQTSYAQMLEILYGPLPDSPLLLSRLNDLLYRLNCIIIRLNEVFIVLISVLTFLF